MTQRMHVVTVRFPAGTALRKIQTAYDDGFIMPDGSWRRIETDPPTVEIGCVLDGEVPFEKELEFLKQGLAEFVTPDFEIISVGAEEDHRDLDPCFANA
jgi:hypothetical protein